MAKLQASSVTGLVTATLDAFRKRDITDLTADVQKFTALGSLMTKNRFTWPGGEQFTFVLQTDDNGAARATGLFDTDAIVTKDNLVTGTVPVRHFTTNCAFDDREPTFNRGEAQIVDHIALRKRAALLSIHKLMERQWWGKPATSSDTESLWGVQLFVTYPTAYATIGTGAFTGGNPSGFTGGYAGISTTTYPRWANWYDEYTALTYDDVGQKWIKASIKCDFSPAVPYAGARTAGGYGYYTNLAVMLELYRIIKSQNDNWGQAVDAGAGGTPLFRRVPVNHVPHLDATTTGETDARSSLAAYNPIYGLDWSTIKVAYFGNQWLAMKVKDSAFSHHVTEVHWDLSCNAVCLDRRPNFLLALDTLC